VLPSPDTKNPYAVDDAYGAPAEARGSANGEYTAMANTEDVGGGKKSVRVAVRIARNETV
jgi:hypothetical protein